MFIDFRHFLLRCFARLLGFRLPKPHFRSVEDAWERMDELSQQKPTITPSLQAAIDRAVARHRNNLYNYDDLPPGVGEALRSKYAPVLGGARVISKVEYFAGRPEQDQPS